MKEQLYIKSYEDDTYIGIEFDESNGITSTLIPSNLSELAKMSFDDQMEELRKFPSDQLKFTDDGDEMADSMSYSKYTHVIELGTVFTYNRYGDII